MFENITVGVLVGVAVLAGIWSWWFSNHTDDDDSNDSDKKDNSKHIPEN